VASWNVVTPLLSVRAVPVTRRRTNWSIASHEDQGGEPARRGDKSCDHVRGRHFLVLCSRGPIAVSASIINRFGLRLG
jgi:hypothetical protein